MASVYIHIGAPKTATSTLQAILAKNDRVLRRQGVLYPHSCRHASAHHPLICDLIEQYSGHRMPDMWYGGVARGSSWSALGEELARAGDAHTAIVSSELFFGQARHIEGMLEDIRSALPGHRLRVVAYLRRQDQMYGSFYNQDVKGTRQWYHSAYQFYETHQLFQRDYHSLLSAWGEALGKDNVLIRPFDPSRWFQGDIVQDFCRLTGIPPLEAGNLESNESLGHNQLYIKRCLNRVGFDKALNEQVVALLQQLCPEQPARNVLYVNKKLYRKYRHEWLQTNAVLAQDFLAGEPLFDGDIPMPRDLVAYTVENEALLQFLGRVGDHFRRRRRGELRQLFARGAMLVIAQRNLWPEVGAELPGTLQQWV